MTEPFEVQSLAGWGRLAPAECQIFRPESRRAIGAILSGNANGGCIARGLGRSYGDTSVNGGGGVLDMLRMDRMLGFDAETGILECEAGTGLQDIIEVFLPRGFFLPVTPGTKFVTVGGAIANDIHGKNHHCDGTFTQHVTSLELMTSGGEVLKCRPEENKDVFWATAGGIGLTGVILTAKLRLQRVETAYMSVDYQRTANLDAVLAVMAESDRAYKYSVAWIDCLARGQHLGRSVLMRANHASRMQLPGNINEPLRPKLGGFPKTVPFDFPGFALNPVSVTAFNTLFYALHRDAEGVIVDYDKYFYPLDSVHDWNRVYGKRGLIQYQVAFPYEAAEGLREILERLAASRRSSFLAVLKCFGESNPGLLSYPFKGYTLALDLPNHPGLIPFLHELDQIVLAHGGRLYLAKDAVTRPETFADMYPKLDAFREIKERLDPEMRLTSSMARRLRLAPGRAEAKP